MPHSRDAWIDLADITIGFLAGFVVMFCWGIEWSIDALDWSPPRRCGG